MEMRDLKHLEEIFEDAKKSGVFDRYLKGIPPADSEKILQHALQRVLDKYLPKNNLPPEKVKRAFRTLLMTWVQLTADFWTICEEASQGKYGWYLRNIPYPEQDDVLNDTVTQCLKLKLKYPPKTRKTGWKGLFICWLKIFVRRWQGGRNQEPATLLGDKAENYPATEREIPENNPDLDCVLGWRLSSASGKKDPPCEVLQAQLRMNQQHGLSAQESDYVFFTLFFPRENDQEFQFFPGLTQCMAEHGCLTKTTPCSSCGVAEKAQKREDRDITKGRISQIRKASMEKYRGDDDE